MFLKLVVKKHIYIIIYKIHKDMYICTFSWYKIISPWLLDPPQLNDKTLLQKTTTYFSWKTKSNQSCILRKWVTHAGLVWSWHEWSYSNTEHWLLRDWSDIQCVHIGAVLARMFMELTQLLLFIRFEVCSIEKNSYQLL